ncbi:methyl-accepting chemotaxis protein [Paenibacillus mendelii]|uniref:Methyl-accepting chemotaxis protein n=1 Tax=Paenibacillus mendelii TaxID=206163 RepID=A0ABV6JAK3_9BACL|nr:methyl-accepting chemotaxis protein [Paenibacillus mendelii]MCQ6560698.1 methyl-accepting chemotaxis protein [Paenibacillus mendelii]
MRWFANLNLFAKFCFCFLLIFLILLGNSLFGMKQMERMNDNFADVFDNRMKSMNEIGAVSANFHKMIAHLGSYVYQNKAVEEKAAMLESIAEYRNSIDELLVSLGQKQLSDKAKKELEVFGFVWTSYTPAMDQVIEQIKAGQQDKAVWNYESQIVVKAEGIDRYFASFIKLNEDEAALSFENSNGMYKEAIRISIISLIASLLISGFLGWLMTTSIRRPVRELLRHFSLVADGMMTESVTTTRKDEMGQLLTSFERMRSNLHDLVAQTKRMIGVLSNHADEIRHSAEVTGDAAHAMRSGLTAASQETMAMYAQVQQDVVVIHEMLTGLMEVTEGVNAISEQSSDSESSVHEGRTVVDEAIRSMGSIRDRVHRSLDEIGTVKNASAKIGNVMRSIEGLMKQTHILALNASIEAARSGEHGKGFMVIAQEVSKLAQQTRTASDEVNAYIGAISQDIDGLHKSMTEENVEVEAGIHKVELAGNQFYTISHSILKMNDSLQHVSATLEELAAGGTQMNQAMERIGQFSKETSEGMGEFVHIADGQSLSMNDVNASVQHLAAEFEVLFDKMERFKTNIIEDEVNSDETKS